MASAPLESLQRRRKTKKEPCTLRAQTGCGEGGARGRERCAEEGGPGRPQTRPGAGPRRGRRRARAGLPGKARPAGASAAQLLLKAAKATAITTTSNFLQEPHTGGEKISQAFPMKSFPQALPTPRASWPGAGPSSLLGAQGEAAAVCDRLRAHSGPGPLTSPRNVLLPFTKHLSSPPA